MQNITFERKCFNKTCPTPVIIGFNTFKDVVYYENKYYHKHCFLELIEKRTEQAKNKTTKQYLKWMEVKKNLNEILSFSEQHIRNSLYKDVLNDFLLKTYNMTVIPSYIWLKLTQITKGEYKNISVKIPLSEILDMWERQMKFLDKLAYDNMTKGKELINGDRINYDLSVLLNKYDSYLQWKEKNKVLDIEEEKKVEEDKYQQEHNSSYYHVSDKSEEKDLFAIANEIFGYED